MTQIDADDVVRRLSEALAQCGLEWLAQEVSAAVQEGRHQEKIKVKRPRGRSSSSAPGDEKPTPGQRAEFTRTIPYSPQEQLVHLINATIGLFEDSASMNAALVEEFGTVTFEPERSIAGRDRFVLDKPSVEAQQQAKERVVVLSDLPRGCTKRLVSNAHRSSTHRPIVVRIPNPEFGEHDFGCHE